MRISVSQEFILLGLFIVCIPFLVITIFGLFSIQAKKEARIHDLLDFGVELTSFNLDKNHNQFQLIANLISEYGELASKDLSHIKRLPPRCQNLINSQAGLELQLVDTHFKPVYANLRSFPTLISVANKQSVTSTIEKQHDANGHDEIYYYTHIPIHKPNTQQIKGYVDTRFPLNKRFKLQKLLKRYPGLALRVFVFDQHQNPITLSSSDEILLHLDNRWLKTQPPFGQFVTETNGSSTYISRWRPLKNHTHQTIGGIVVSAESKYFDDSYSNQLFILIALGCFSAIIFIGYQFQSDWLKPIDSIIASMERVSLGNYDIRLIHPPKPVPLQQLYTNFNRILSIFEEEKKMRETFSSCLAHDIKTPLFSQKRTLETLSAITNPSSQELADITKSLSMTNQELLKLIELFLDAYRDNESNFIPDKTLTELKPLLEGCINTIQPHNLRKQIDFIIDIPTKFPPIFVDQVQMKRALTNLFSNAIENIPGKGSITITASTTGSMITIQVCDTGAGIEPDNIPFIFQRFWSTKNRHQTLTSGLGLYIVRLIVEAHQGTIQVESELNKGTCFTIVIPNSIGTTP